ncbi:MAG: GGDEF domain-containing protein, partial [Arcobacteraceae bacterium]
SGEYQYLFKNIFDNNMITIFLECGKFFENEIMLLDTYFKEIIYLFCIETTLSDLKQSATIYPLTQLQNRISFNNEMKRLVPLAIREKMKLGVLLINIDRFRAVNDEHGDEFGDRFLRLYADTIKKCIRTSDIAVRFGGGEFLIILVHVKSIEMTMQIAEKIKNTLTNTYLLSPNNDKFKKTVSIGISLFPDDSNDIHEVIKFSEMALLDVKDTGRNKLSRYEKLHRGSIELF